MTTPVKANPTSKLQTALASQPTREGSLESMIQTATKELGKALPSHMSPERIVRIALTCIRQNPDLARCTPASFLGSLFSLAATGLEPINGLAYLIPFNNRKKVNGEWVSVKETQAIIGYKGYVNLFYRHESSLSIDVQTVFENDDFDYRHGTSAFLNHKPALRNRGKAIGFYACAKLKGGADLFHFMSVEDCTEHGKAHSKTFDSKTNKFYDSSPWVTEFEAMAKKTCILQLSKLLPLSFELQRALSVDETSRDYRDGIDSALDMPTTSWKTEEPAQTPESGPIEPEPTQTPVPEEKAAPGSFAEFAAK